MPALLDPTSELLPAQREALPRPPSLSDKRVALLDISKPRGDVIILRRSWATSASMRGAIASPPLRGSRLSISSTRSPASATSSLKPSPIEAHARRAVCTTSLTWKRAGYRACSSLPMNLSRRPPPKARLWVSSPPPVTCPIRFRIAPTMKSARSRTPPLRTFCLN